MSDSVVSPLTPALPCLLHPMTLGLGVEVAQRDTTGELELQQAGRQPQGRQLLLDADDGGYSPTPAPCTH